MATINAAEPSLVGVGCFHLPNTVGISNPFQCTQWWHLTQEVGDLVHRDHLALKKKKKKVEKIPKSSLDFFFWSIKKLKKYLIPAMFDDLLDF